MKILQHFIKKKCLIYLKYFNHFRPYEIIKLNDLFSSFQIHFRYYEITACPKCQGLPTAVRTRTANGRLQVNPGDVAAWRTVHMFRNDAEARERLLTVILSDTFWPVDAIEPNNANSVVIDPTLNPEEALVGWPAVSYADIHRWLRTALRWNRYFVVQFMRPYIMRSANQRRTSYWAQALDNFALVGHNMDLTRNNSLLSNVAHAFRMQAQVNPVAPAASSSSSTTSSVPTDDTMHDPTPTGSPSNEPRE